MEAITSFFNYIARNWFHLIELTISHIAMVIVGVVCALVIGVCLGILSSTNKRLASIILALTNVIQVFPSLALLALLMLFFGLGFNTVVVGLFLYSLLPIVRNTYVGLNEVDKGLVEAGKGIGMTKMQILFQVKMPMSVPFILAGIRIAAVIAIGVATLAPFIGGEGLGREIVSGINLRDSNKIYAGAIIAAILAVCVDFVLGRVQKRFEVR